MEKIDRQFLENFLGTSPSIEDINATIELLEEWKAELKE